MTERFSVFADALICRSRGMLAVVPSSSCMLVLMAALTAAIGSTAVAQPRPGLPPADPADGVEALADSARRKIQDLMPRIREAQATEPLRAAELFDTAWALAVAREDPLVELNTDAFDLLQPGQHQVNAGSRSQLVQLYLEAPRAFRNAYQQFVAADANQALQPDPAAEPEQLIQAVLRYQFTEQGRRTLQLLVRVYESRGEYLNAALEYGRWLHLQNTRQPDQTVRLAMLWWKAGLPEEAVGYLRDLLPQHAEAMVSVGERDLQLPATSAQARDWLAEYFGPTMPAAGDQHRWSQLRGNFRRNGRQQTGPAELVPQWTASVFECVWNPELQILLEPLTDAIQRLALRALEAGNTIVPAASPLVTDELVVFRGVANLRAVERATGKLRWETSLIDQQLQSAMDAVYRNEEERPGNLDLVQAILRSSLFGHLVRSNTGGQLTQAGDLLFAVEEVTSETMQTDWDPDLPKARRAVNYLRAYNIHTGQTLGVLGGTVGLGRSEQAPNPLRGFYVLGAPLVIGDRIYLMAENDQGIFLLQLLQRQFDQRRRPYSQQPVHSQLLSIPRHELRSHPVRRFAGLSPSFGQGLLICNTCDEKVIAVSAEDHSVRWIYRYPSNVALPELNHNAAVIGNASSARASDDFDLAIRWTDSLPRIVDDRILITPRDSDRLICLELQSGRELWSRPRGRNRQLVFADSQRIVLTGNNHVECRKTADGSLLWQSQLSGGFVSGRAAVSDSVIHVPTSQPAIVALQLLDGRQLLRQPLDVALPGNLLSLDGQMFQQSLTNVTCFSPDRSKSLIERATAQFFSGRIDEAEQELQAALNEATDAALQRQARTLLIESQLEGLRLNYNASEERLLQLQNLIDQNVPSISQLQQLTARLLNVAPATLDRLIPAIDDVDDGHRYRQKLQVLRAEHQFDNPALTEADFVRNAMEVLEKSFADDEDSVLEGLWTRRTSRIALASIRAALQRRPDSDDLRQQLSTALQQRIAAATSEADSYWWIDAALAVDLPQAAVSSLLNQSYAGPAFAVDLLWHAALNSKQVPLDDQRRLTDQQRTRFPETVQSLVGRSTQHQQQAAQDVPEIPADIRSAEDFLLPPDEPITKQLLNQATTEGSANEQRTPWTGVPEVAESDAHSVRPDVLANPHALVDQIPLYGPAGAFAGWAFARVTGVDGIVALDGEGRHRWVFNPGSLLLDGRQYGTRYNRLSTHYAVAHGSLLAIKLHHLVFLLDCSSASIDQPPEMLWRINLFQSLDRPSLSQQADPAWQRTTQYDLRPAGLFPMGPLTQLGLPLYSGRQLVMTSLLTGEPLWTVSGLPDDCLLSADQDELLLTSEAAGTTEVRSAVDGSVIARTPLPDWWTEAAENSNGSIRDFTLEPEEEQRWRLRLDGHHCLLLVRSLKESRLESYHLKSATVTWSLKLPADSVVSNIVDNHLAILQDGTRLQIIHLASGSQVVDLNVPPATNSRELYLRPADDRWVVFTDVFDQEHDQQNPVGATTSVQVNGPIYAVHPQSGQLDWSATADHEFLRILHPSQFPFPAVTPLLTLLKQPYRRSPEGLIRGAVVQARILDARSGNELYAAKDLGYGLSYHRLCPIAEEQKVQISFDKRTVTFDYAGKDSQ